MPLEALTSPDAVLAAIAEFDEIGRDAFLARYGFGPARDIVVVHEGRRYDSKAIVAAAHGHQQPELGPLRNQDFNGGRPTISKLTQLGFEIERLNPRDADVPAAGPLLGEFLGLYANTRREPFGGSHRAVDVLKRAAEALKQRLPPSLAHARVRPSVGQGNWATVPWIAVLDARETNTTQHGIYPVLLIPEDLGGVYLSIAQGVTDLKRDRGRLAAYATLSERAQALRPRLAQLASVGFGDGEDVELGTSNLGRDYAASVVIWKYFDRDALVSDIDDDFAALCVAYGELLESGALDVVATEVHTPSVMSVYVGRGAEQNFATGGRRGWWGWRQPHRELSDVQPGDLILFGFGYSGGSPRVPADTWAQHRIERAAVGRIEQIPFRTDEAVMPDEIAGTASYPYKIRFELLQEFSNVHLNEQGGLSASVAEAIRLSAVRQGAGIVRPAEGSALLEHLIEQKGLVQPRVPIDQVAGSFTDSVGASGLRLDQRLVGTFVVAALTKPFLILTGLSGSGKTQLAKRLGEWCGADARGRPRYEVVPVRPDWTGPEYLFGFPDALQSRVDGQSVWAVPETLEFLLRANAEPAKPFVLVLDEMNLAHVERYFADFLSGLESREPVLPDLHQRDGTWLDRDSSRRIPLPRNLTVVGTVNIDETTYLFSPKVLDRAFTFEFRVRESDLEPDVRRPSTSEAAPDDTLQSLVAYQQHDDWQFEHPHPLRDDLAGDLRELHRILSPAGLEFGHRVMYESLRFAAMLGAALHLGRDEALDAIALTKVLPKIHGARQRLEPVLGNLIAFAEGSAEAAEPRLPATAAKARRMLGVLLEAQFVSFTE